ncbi:MAG: ornithine carbamoyltransferase, partial [Acidimicrobiales bacterium]
MLGAIAVEISGAVGEGEEIADMATYLGNWFDAIVVRPPSFRSLAVLAEATPAMVVNARTRLNHPCEILGDLAAVHASGHDITDTTNVVFVGEATDLCYSWLEAAAVLALALTQVCPPGFQADIEAWQQLTPSPAGTVQVAHDFEDVL